MSGKVATTLVWVTLTDFLVARSLETLEAGSCDYTVAGNRVICNCDAVSDPVAQALNDLDLIRWCDTAFGPENPIEAILADQYATHPDYKPQWHFLISAQGRPPAD